MSDAPRLGWAEEMDRKAEWMARDPEGYFKAMRDQRKREKPLTIRRFWREYCPHLMLFNSRRVRPERLAGAIKSRSRSYRIWFVWRRLMILTESRKRVAQEKSLEVRPDLGVR